MKIQKICIRVDENLYENLKMAAEDRGIKVSTFVRELVEKNGKVERPVVNSETARKILVELSRQGNNINQLTKVIKQKCDINNDDVHETYNLILDFGRQRSIIINLLRGGGREDGIYGTNQEHA